MNDNRNDRERPESDGRDANRDSDRDLKDDVEAAGDNGGDQPRDTEASQESGDQPGDQSRDRRSVEGDGDFYESQRSESDELIRMREAMLRMQAEMDNREKRLEREMAKTRRFAIERLVSDLIPVLDSIDQALAASGGDSSGPEAEGLELTRKQAVKVLSSHGLDVLDPLGEPFDPTWHEAIATQPSEDQPADSVLQVLQKGYRLNERLVRPARVIVAKDA